MKKMEEDKKVVILVISSVGNEADVELFRVHIHEKSIRFDAHFEEGIKGHKGLSEDVKELNNLWKEHEIGADQIYPIMLHLMNKYGDYLAKYYFTKEELDKDGHYVEFVHQDKATAHYLYLKRNKRLKRISKKEFEKNITSKEIANYYVDNYVKKGALFYSAEHIDASENKTMWYFMVVDNKFKISFFIVK